MKYTTSTKLISHLCKVTIILTCIKWDPLNRKFTVRKLIYFVYEKKPKSRRHLFVETLREHETPLCRRVKEYNGVETNVT